MARHKDRNWDLPDPIDWECVPVALLMDIRDALSELREIRQSLHVLRCPNFVDIPRKLDHIRINTVKPKRKRKPKVDTK